jgi:hypothetical protein
MNHTITLFDLLGHSNVACAGCLYEGYLNCLKPVSLNDLTSEPHLNEVSPVELLTLESTNPVDKYDKFQGWSDWETLTTQLEDRANLSKQVFVYGSGTCLRFKKGNAFISRYTLSGKWSFR